MEKELQALRDEKEKLEEVEAERERGTAKGRSFEEAVVAAVDAIALAQGDVAEAVGDVTEATGKVGDVVVALDACNGPRAAAWCSRPRTASCRSRGAGELDRAMAERSADFAVLVVPTEEELPAKLEPLREYNGDKLVVALDPDGGRWRSRLGYRLARARVLMKRSDADGIDAGALRDTVERALGRAHRGAQDQEQLTGAKTASTGPTGWSRDGRAGARAPPRRSTRWCAPADAEPATSRPTSRTSWTTRRLAP